MKDSINVTLSPIAQPILSEGSPGVEVAAVRLEDASRPHDAENTRYYKETYELVLRQGEKEIGIQPVVENEWGLHQWQYAVVEPLWSSSYCAGYLAGGHIYCGEDIQWSLKRFQYEHAVRWLPADETIAVQFYIVVFADGTVEVTPHFINGLVYYKSGPVFGVPMLLFRGLKDALPEAPVEWDGENPILQGDGMIVDFSPSAHLVSSQHPGRILRKDDRLAWQPLEAMTLHIRNELDGSGNPRPTIVEGSTEGFAQGIARSTPFIVSLAEKPTRCARYLAPPHWYAENEEIAPMPLAHIEGEFSKLSAMGAEAFIRSSAIGSIISGGINRSMVDNMDGEFELSMDGNEARSLFRRCYWGHDARVYDLALRNVYFCADIGMDHAKRAIHYHGDRGSWQVSSLIYQRFSGIVYGYLETGDPYLLDTAVMAAHGYMDRHQQNWPRKGLGRDLDPLAGFAVLYDYTGDEHWLDFSRNVANHTVRVIDENGAWACGAGVGPYWGVNAMEGGAWNGGHFFHGFTEYLMRSDEFPEAWKEPARRALRKLLRELWDSEHRLHPAACGFVPRLHWYLACRLGDEELIDLVRKLMDHMLVYRDNPTRDPLFAGGMAHHMNNYLDYLLFYEATKDSLPDMLKSR